MAAQGTKLAYSGHPPGYVPHRNAFDWALSQPFQQQSDYTPADHVVPAIEPNRAIFVDDKTDRPLSHAQIRNDALALAAGLRSLGLDANDLKVLPPTPTCPRPEIAPIVLVQLPNCMPYAPILLGIFASGLTATLVSPALTSSEIAWILQSARPRVIITSKACLAAMTSALASQSDKPYFSALPVFTYDPATDVYPLRTTATPSPSDWTSLLSPHPMLSSHPLPLSSPRTRTAVILWSSGTSGRSKGVLLSHHTLNFNTASLWHDADFYQPGRRQHWLGYVPFYHVFGLCTSLLLSICSGATTYVMPSFNLESVLAAVPRRGVTYFHMAPPVAVMLAKSPLVEKYAKSDAFGSVAAGITGGAPLGHEVVVEVYRRLGFRIRLGYGLSETCSTSLQRGLSEADMHAAAGDSGLPHWGTEVMIDADGQGGNGVPRVAAVGESGEILVRGPGLMMAYLPIGTTAAGEPDMSASLEALTGDGWFRTGDIGHIDEGGKLSITDRLKELIKVRAYQVAPAELEAVLCSSELVADAGVIGVYDASEATEWPRAYVVARNKGTTREELERVAQELRGLVEKRAAKYKWLVGGIVFVDQIPKSPSGKILRRVLKEGKVTGTEVQIYVKKVRHAKL
ncbi:acetyl-CoA synthetase-like protein [Coniochaeta ligniaria NRRL 30616]|uniref:Acetyl-CoA synthetase-like protein n=1 Tax=Coniochaeta ligniaria NRRL 30616 TaxID=1408157 RepID=A0A1J7JIT5_9PEZI|nr:acetyl-CoA synthetase-like protein [Coniochaeta ligniaria NRRL 30616]